MFHHMVILLIIFICDYVYGSSIEDNYYLGAVLVFEYSDPYYTILLGTYDRDTAVFGSDSPIRNVTGTIVLPQHDTTGCQAGYSGVEQYTNWIALVARGDCKFYTKIKNAESYNASAVVVYDFPRQTTPVVMSHDGADEIVAVSAYYEVGQAVKALVNQNIHVTGHIVAGSSHSIPDETFPIERTSIIFVSVSFMILMAVSLIWLVFYYIQKFRMIRNQHRGLRRQKEMFLRAMRLMPTRYVKDSDELIESEQVCPICLEIYKVGDRIRDLPCKHSFHRRCVDPWLEKKKTCPMCKVNVLKGLGLMDHDNPSLLNDDGGPPNPLTTTSTEALAGDAPAQLNTPETPLNHNLNNIPFDNPNNIPFDNPNNIPFDNPNITPYTDLLERPPSNAGAELEAPSVLGSPGNASSREQLTLNV